MPLKEDNTWLRGTNKGANTKDTSGRTCVMVLGYFTIKMEACTKANGGLIACKARVNYTISLEN